MERGMCPVYKRTTDKKGRIWGGREGEGKSPIIKGGFMCTAEMFLPPSFLRRQRDETAQYLKRNLRASVSSCVYSPSPSPRAVAAAILLQGARRARRADARAKRWRRSTPPHSWRHIPDDGPILT